MLAALVLAGHHQPGGKVRDANRGVGHVDVLSARAAGAESIDAEIVVFDINLDFVVDLRINENRRKRRVAARGGIERRNAHQAMYADFRLQHAKGIRAIDFEGDGFNARAFAFEAVRDDVAEFVALAPAEIHAHEHFGPVLRLGAARARMDGDDGGELIVFAREQHPGFEFAEQRRVALERTVNVVFDFFAFTGEFEKGVEIVGQGGDFLAVFDGLFEALAVLHHLLALLRLRPEVGRRNFVGGAF